MTNVEQYEPWRNEFRVRTQMEETEVFVQQVRSVLTEIGQEFVEDDGGVPLEPPLLDARKRLIASLIQDLIDLRRRAARGCIHGSGIQNDRDSEWCYPLNDHEKQLGELKHPVSVEGQGATDILGWQFRMYFAAPLIEPALILYLVFGRKPIAHVSAEWRAIQDGHIALAKSEFTSWQLRRRFGHTLPAGGG